MNERRDMDQLHLEDRSEINNVWDKHPALDNARSILASGDDKALLELSYTGISLLTSNDPYQVKTGLQILRICLPRNEAVVDFWMKNQSDSLVRHDHPRVRHSALWNVRTALWFNSEYAEKSLSLAKQGLMDDNHAVQRVAMWTHGDVVINSPDFFEDAKNSIDSFIRNNPEESSALFALEEFFTPLRGKHAKSPEYTSSIQTIIDSFPGYIGLKRRAGNLIGIGSEVIDESDSDLAIERIIAMTSNLPIGEAVKNGNYAESVRILLEEANSSNSYSIKMRNTWLIRELLWLDESISEEVFDDLSQVVLGNSDGDLIRTTCVVIGDCLLLNESLSAKACDFVQEFFEVTDNDGSQIVVAQTLRAISGTSEEAGLQVKQIIPTLRSKAANKSVLYAVELLAEDINE